MIAQGTIIITVLLSLVTMAVPRKYLLLPYVVAACFVPADQRVIIADLDFTPLRILVIVGVLRLWLRGDIVRIKWNRFDKVVLLWAVTGAVIYVLQSANIKAVVYKCGALYDILGLYWIFRQAICSWDDVKLLLKMFAICTTVMAGFIAYELATGRNPFVVLGRVGTVVRLSKYRCQASFPHSIMLGIFWATLFPLFVGLARIKERKYLFHIAGVLSIFIVCATWASTPILTLIGIICFLPLFRYRHYTRIAGWALIGLITALHVVMEAPVWHLIGRIRFIGGSTGYHRYKIIDEAINHFSEWALLGTRSTGHWGWGLQDITNQFVLEGVRGGALTLLLFIIMLVIAFQALERNFRGVGFDKEQWLAWCVFVALIGHCISFIGASYFGQMVTLWYLTLAIIGFVVDSEKQSRRLLVRVPAKHFLDVGISTVR
jgi:hypothetical protein